MVVCQQHCGHGLGPLVEACSHLAHSIERVFEERGSGSIRQCKQASVAEHLLDFFVCEPRSFFVQSIDG
jgi:hypothetical protein